MKKRYLLLLIPVFVAFLEYGPRMFMQPEQRTQAYFALQRKWLALWPFEKGKYLPELIQPGFFPLVPVWYEIRPNIKLHLDPEDYGPRIILATGEYETGSFNLLRQRLSPGATLIDVGANFGIYSLMAAPVVGHKGRIIAVEPNPDALKLLRANIAASDASMISVAPVACSDAEAMLDLYVAPRSNGGETSLSQTNATQEGAVSHTYKVRARPLDDIVRESGVTRVDAMKIDVEGAELLVLKGAAQTLDRYHPMLLIEIVERQLKGMGTSSTELREFLRAHGYREGRHDDINFEFIGDTKVSGIR